MGFKIAIGAVWLYGAACFFSPGLPLAGLGRAAVGIMLVVHLIECVAFLPRLRAAGGSLGNHLFQTFLFGIAHVRTLPPAAESAP